MTASRWGQPKRTQADKLTSMRLELYRCTDAALAGKTVDGLVASHGVDRKIAEYELIVARNKRAVLL